LSNRPLVLCAFVVSVAALSACGGSSVENEIEDVIEASATSTDPANCTKLNTRRFMTQLAQEGGPGAVRECEREAEEGEGAESAGVSNVEAEFDRATAEVTLTGAGGLDGQPLVVELVKQGDQWKMDETLEFAKFDRAKLAEAFEAEFARRSSEVSPKLAACFTNAFRAESQSRVEEMLFRRSPRAWEEIARSCNLNPSA
jgi:hypothetical protein